MRDVIAAELKRKGFRVHISGVRDELNICCPFCVLRGKSADTEYKLGFNTRKNKGHCFRCGWRSRNAAAELKIPVTISFAEEKVDKKKPVVLPEDFELLVHNSHDIWMQRAWEYVTSRGISPEQIRKYRVGLSLVGRHRFRVIFPIYHDNKLRGFSGRSIHKSIEPKWLHSKHLTVPYLLKRSVTASVPTIILVEGIFDALSVNRWLPYCDVMAVLGTHISEEKEKYLEPYHDVVIWFDPDKAGCDAMVDLSPKLETLRKSVSRIESHADPSDLSQHEIHEAFIRRRAWSPLESLASQLKLNEDYS